jgi:signal transduction histidine kinase
MSEIIKYQLNRGVSLVNNVQVLSEVEMLKPKFSTFNLVEVLEILVSKVKTTLPRNKVEIILNCDKEQLLIEADEYISHIFKNLINNGIRHNSNEFKTILVNISTEMQDKSSQVRVEIKDNGMGLNFAHKQHLKNFFEGNVKSYNRSGLGLLDVKNLTSRYNGKIYIQDRVENDYTKGSKFILFFPLSHGVR